MFGYSQYIQSKHAFDYLLRCIIFLLTYKSVPNYKSVICSISEAQSQVNVDQVSLSILATLQIRLLSEI